MSKLKESKALENLNSAENKEVADHLLKALAQIFLKSGDLAQPRELIEALGAAEGND